MRCRLTESSELLRRELGDEFVDSYVKLKNREWNDYSRQLTAVGARQHARLLDKRSRRRRMNAGASTSEFGQAR